MVKDQSPEHKAYHERLGRTLKAERKQRGLTQHAFGERLGIGVIKYAKIEKGINACPLWVFRKACVFLKINPMKLLFLKRKNKG